MVYVEVFGTGSKGNCYLLNVNGDALILDAGVSVKSLIAKCVSFRGIDGVLVTHEHKDHAKYANDWVGYGVPVYGSAGTLTCSGIAGITVKANDLFTVGKFEIIPFEVEHDAREPLGFLIRHKPSGITVLYATDTYHLKYKFPGVYLWMIECNWSVISEDDPLKERLRRSHMSLERLKEIIRANDMSKTQMIMLLHLSARNSNEEQMVKEIADVSGVDTVAAHNDGKYIILD